MDVWVFGYNAWISSVIYGQKDEKGYIFKAKGSFEKYEKFWLFDFSIIGNNILKTLRVSLVFIKFWIWEISEVYPFYYFT